MGDFYRFLESQLFTDIIYGCFYFLLILSAFNIFSICFRGTATRRLSKNAGLLDGAKSFLPYARNVLLCRTAEKLYEKKHGTSCTEYSKYCSTLQVGNISADLCAAILAVLAFVMYGKGDYEFSASVTAVLVSAGICFLFRLIFGLSNRIVIAKSLGIISDTVTGKTDKAAEIFCIIAPIADIYAFILSRKI